MPLRLLLLLLFAIFSFASPSFSSDEPFTGPANWGGTGLMEVPTARVMSEGEYRFGIGNVDPYWYYYGAFSPLKGLEIDGRVTKVEGVPGFSGNTSYGNYKDKAVDLKYQILPEGKYSPAVAIGMMDPHGTRKYPSQYLVASKQIFPFDLTVGLGNGRFGDVPLAEAAKGYEVEMFEDTGRWLRESNFFFGIQFAPSKRFALMAEYSPIRYEKQTTDPARDRHFTEPVPSKFNFGIRWRPFDWGEIDASYQRGNRLGINLSMDFELGKPFIPIYDPPYRERAHDRPRGLFERLVSGLSSSGFSDIGVAIEGDGLWVDAENGRYYYTPRGAGVALQIISGMVPEDVQKVHLILKKNGIPVIEYVTRRDDLREYFSGTMTFGEFHFLSKTHTDLTSAPAGEKVKKKYFFYGLNPAFRSFLNDPSGFFKYRLGVSVWSGFKPWKGGSLIAGLEAFAFNTVSTSNKPLSIPVRSDIVQYQQDNIALERLMFEQMVKAKGEIHLRGSAGLLDIQYAGFDGEAAVPLLDGRFMVGLGGSVVKKREPGEPLNIKDDPVKDYFKTAFVNARLNIPEEEVYIDLKAGRFLAGDEGMRITVSKFFNGVILSAWYSMTDTDIFSDVHNRGYHDKGIALTVPLRLFKGSDSRTSYSTSLSPWTRDVAQDIDHFTPLFDYMGRDVGIYLEKDRDRFHTYN